MSRGEIEIDLAESRSAALRELGAAARKQRAPIPAWQQRDYGRIVRLDAAIAAAKARLPFSDEDVQFRQDRIDALRAQLISLEREDAVKLATSDFRERDVPLAPNPERRVLCLLPNELLRFIFLSKAIAFLRHSF
jgi:hypothetical protein